MSDIELFILTGVISALLFISFIISFLLVNQKRHFKYLKEKQELKNEFDKTLVQAQLEIREDTLKYVSYELHDNLGQIASLIKIHLNTLPWHDQPKAKLKLEETKELTRQLIADLKLLSVSLSGDRVVAMGLLKGIESEVEKMNKTEECEARLTVDGVFKAPDDKTTIILYRMVQEIFNNILKHSEARHVHILIKSIEKMCILVITDDGVGFHLEERLAGGGSGLRNLHNRAKLISAQLEIESTPGAGTKIQIALPLPHEN